MPRWTLIETHSTHGPTFRRPLDMTELWFLWNGLFDGGTDGLQYCELRLPNVSQDAHLFSDANIIHAWLSTKRRYPLTGARVRGVDNAPLQINYSEDSTAGNGAGFTSEPHFFVYEGDFTVVRSHEIVFGNVASAEEAQQYMVTLMTGPRPLSPELLVQLYVFRETNPNKIDALHLMILIAHCVTDRMAISTFLRCLVDTLARGGGSEPDQLPLEERLAMMIPSVDLEPMHLRSLSPAVRRWRRAAGAVILQLKMAKQQGGYTIPCRMTQSTPHVAAKSGLVATILTLPQTSAVIENCRLHGIKFGNAFIVLSQVAMTRVLFRRYIRGEISEEEWAYRKRQPYFGGGPLSLRRYLDKAWFENGGGGEPMLSLGFFFFHLPFMTLGKPTERRQRVLLNGAPLFSDLLTFDRFLHRVALLDKQMKDFFKHPLLLEIIRAIVLAQGEHTRLEALQWLKHIQASNDKDTRESPKDEVLAATDIPVVWAFGGSSTGNLDLMSPMEYPLPSTHPLSPYSPIQHPARAGYISPPSTLTSAPKANVAPTIVVANSKVHIRSRPAELYLTADSLYGQMNLQVFYDGNVFEDGVVKEWLDEVKEAVLWYLGRTHQPRRIAQTGTAGQLGFIESAQAKL